MRGGGGERCAARGGGGSLTAGTALCGLAWALQPGDLTCTGFFAGSAFPKGGQWRGGGEDQRFGLSPSRWLRLGRCPGVEGRAGR